jgi:hypothetical protein
LNLVSYTLTTGIFNSNNSNTRTLAFGTGKIVVLSTAGTILNLNTVTGLTVTGNSLVQATTVATTGTRIFNIGNAGEANAISVDVTAGSDTVQLSTTNAAYKNVNLTGFAGTVSIVAAINIYGNFNFGGATAYTGTSVVTFAATSGTKTITTNSLAFGGGVTFNGIGGTWACQDALNVTSSLIMTNGTLQLAAGATSDVGGFATSGTNQKYLQSTTPGTQATISDASGTNTASYLTIQDINATGGAVWNALALTSVDAGNNTGWYFSAVPEIEMRLRSFTQPRRF